VNWNTYRRKLGSCAFLSWNSRTSSGRALALPYRALFSERLVATRLPVFLPSRHASYTRRIVHICVSVYIDYLNFALVNCVRNRFFDWSPDDSSIRSLFDTENCGDSLTTFFHSCKVFINRRGWLIRVLPWRRLLSQRRSRCASNFSKIEGRPIKVVRTTHATAVLQSCCRPRGWVASFSQWRERWWTRVIFRRLFEPIQVLSKNVSWLVTMFIIWLKRASRKGRFVAAWYP